MSSIPKLYDDVVMDHIKNVRNYRALPDAQLRAQGVNVLCGDGISVFLRTASDRILEAGFQCECCGISMASASIMTEAVVGLTREEALALERAVVAAVDGRDTLTAASDVHTIVGVAKAFPARRRCALLPWAVLAAALSGRAETKI